MVTADESNNDSRTIFVGGVSQGNPSGSACKVYQRVLSGLASSSWAAGQCS